MSTSGCQVAASDCSSAPFGSRYACPNVRKSWSCSENRSRNGSLRMMAIRCSFESGSPPKDARNVKQHIDPSSGGGGPPMPDRLQMLRNAVLLENVPEGELSQLAALVRPVELKAAETFAVRGQTSPGMGLVDQGALEVILDSTPIWSVLP